MFEILKNSSNVKTALCDTVEFVYIDKKDFELFVGRWRMCPK
jgi:hypothetical protein